MNNKKKAIEVLKKAKSLISRSNRWHQGAFENRVHGKVQGYCMMGALNRAEETVANDLFVFKAREALYNAVPDGDVIGWNDSPGRKHSEVMSAFDEAIESLK